MSNEIRDWLLEDKNPAIKFRTQTELLGQCVATSDTKKWILEKLLTNWFNTKGLWYMYLPRKIGMSKYLYLSKFSLQTDGKEKYTL